MTNIRIVHWDRPADFLESTAEYDDSAMNFTLGSLLDNMDESQAESQARWGPKPRILLGVYRGEELLLTLTRNAEFYSWMMAVPSGVDPSRDPSDVFAAGTLLAAFLPTIIDPTLMDKVVGPEEAVDAFLEAWIVARETQGVRLKTLPPYFKSRGSYATLTTLPPPPTIYHSHAVSLASDSDVSVLVPLYVSFSRHGLFLVTPDGARKLMKEAVNGRRAWVCRLGDVVAGYALVGRTTPRTIAIRNVFVSPEYRRRGIAEALVTAVTRFYLGADRSDSERISRLETKQEVCLNIADPAVERIYERCGFMLYEDARDPVSGKKGWYQSIWRGVAPL